MKVLTVLKKILSPNNILFGTIILVQLFLTFHGKQLGDYLFGEEHFRLNNTFNNTSAWLLLFTIPILLTFLKNKKSIKINSLIIIGVFIGVGFPIIFQILYNTNSILIFTLQSYLFGIALITIIIFREIQGNYTVDFYKLIFDKVIKLIGFILVLFGAGIATLKYVSTVKNEASTGFISSFAYPTIVMISSFIMLGYWVILPCWMEILKSYNSDNVQ